jgi:hypothetical protein
MELTNILLVLAFIVLPVALGIWALTTRRDLLRRRNPTRRAQPPSRVWEQPRSDSEPDVAPAPPPPPRDWARHVQPTRQIRTAPAPVDIPPRQFYPPRYVGRAGGTVTRLTPRAYRLSFRLRSGR